MIPFPSLTDYVDEVVSFSDKFYGGEDLGLLPSDEVLLVCGNQSCDLDSFYSPLLFGYFLRATGQHRRPVPLLSIPRAEVNLRKEFSFLHAQLGFTDAKFLRANLSSFDLPSAFLPLHRCALYLVDHNEPCAQLLRAFGGAGALKGSLRGVLDHHRDSGFLDDLDISGTKTKLKNKDKDVRMRFGVGSCMSLVVDAVLAHEQRAALLRGLGAGGLGVARAVMVVDTVCFSEALERCNDVDRAAYRALRSAMSELDLEMEPNAKMKMLAWSDEQVYREIDRVKNDWSLFSTEELLVKDYKARELPPSGGVVGFANLFVRLERLYARDGGLFDAMRRFAKARGLRVLVLTNFVLEDGDKGEKRREVHAFTAEDDATSVAMWRGLDALLRGNAGDAEAKKVVEKLRLRLNAEFSALGGEQCPGGHFVSFVQSNLAESRKTILPLVMNFLKQEKF